MLHIVGSKLTPYVIIAQLPSVELAIYYISFRVEATKLQVIRNSQL